MSAIFPPEYQQSPPQPPPLPPHRSWPRRHKILTALGSGFGLLVVLIIVIAATSAPSVTMRGTLTVSQTSGSSSFCQGSNVTDPGQGAQVTVTSPSGTVIGTGTLGNPSTAATTLIGCVESVEVYKFKVTGLPGEPRYGVTVASLSGTIWFTHAQLAHANLSLGP
jgi:hypothetical protein